MYENESNQALTGRQISSVFIVIVLLAVLFWSQLMDGSQVDERVYQSKLESMGYQVIELDNRAKSSRSPASILSSGEVLEIGVDPWGRAYLYEYVDFQGSKSLVIWSRGPDGRSQVKASGLKSDEWRENENVKHFKVADDRATLIRFHQ